MTRYRSFLTEHCAENTLSDTAIRDNVLLKNRYKVDVPLEKPKTCRMARNRQISRSTPEEAQMDRIDQKILAELEVDGRLSFAELSDRVGLSKSPCWSRVRELEASAAIQGFGAQINPAAIGLAVQCYAYVRIRLDAHAAFEEAAVAHPAIIECHTTAGDSDYLVRIYARSIEHLDELLRHELSKLPGVHRLSTSICLKTIKSRAPLTSWAQLSQVKR